MAQASARSAASAASAEQESLHRSSSRAGNAAHQAACPVVGCIAGVDGGRAPHMQARQAQSATLGGCLATVAVTWPPPAEPVTGRGSRRSPHLGVFARPPISLTGHPCPWRKVQTPLLAAAPTPHRQLPQRGPLGPWYPSLAARSAERAPPAWRAPVVCCSRPWRRACWLVSEALRANVA